MASVLGPQVVGEGDCLYLSVQRAILDPDDTVPRDNKTGKPLEDHVWDQEYNRHLKLRVKTVSHMKSCCQQPAGNEEYFYDFFLPEDYKRQKNCPFASRGKEFLSYQELPSGTAEKCMGRFFEAAEKAGFYPSQETLCFLSAITGETLQDIIPVCVWHNRENGVGSHYRLLKKKRYSATGDANHSGEEDEEEEEGEEDEPEQGEEGEEEEEEEEGEEEEVQKKPAAVKEEVQRSLLLQRTRVPQKTFLFEPSSSCSSSLENHLNLPLLAL